MEQCGATLVPYSDPAYPALLREIQYPPMLLYLKGGPIAAERLLIAVVGSRNATHYGLRAARSLGAGLAENGVGVVSGLALGIDAAAHEGCLGAGGFPVAVLGTGIDVAYPATNRRLLARVVESGAVLSEFPTGTPPEPKNFPVRNRIISGLSRAVVVVEATRKSGSLITAGFALDQGREVMAVPGSIESFKSTGTHRLIKQGAKLVENTADILEEVQPFSGRLPAGAGEGPEPAPPSPKLNAREREVYEIVGDYPLHVDEIVRLGQLEPALVLSTLLGLELRALVSQLPGRMYVRKSGTLR